MDRRLRAQTAVLYQVERAQPSGPLDRLPRALSWIRVGEPVCEELWLSKGDGSGIRRLGTFSSRNLPGLKQLRWLPDERHISFVSDGMLYVLAVN